MRQPRRPTPDRTTPSEIADAARMVLDAAARKAGLSLEAYADALLGRTVRSPRTAGWIIAASVAAFGLGWAVGRWG